MYQFSRAIYRKLAPQVLPPPPGAPLSRNHEAVLQACEDVVTRLALDRHNFARPERALFSQIRTYFPMSAQAGVHRVVCRYMDAAQQFLIDHPHEGYASVRGGPPGCRATTRKGSPCQRTPLPHNGYCPSHQHLADTENRELAAA